MARQGEVDLVPGEQGLEVQAQQARGGLLEGAERVRAVLR
jgi:hypothetical protein